MSIFSNQKDKIIIADSPVKYFNLLIFGIPSFSVFVYLGTLMISDPNLSYKLAGLASIIFFGLGIPGIIILSIYKLSVGTASIIFEKSGITIRLANKTTVNIPWDEVERIGTQIVGQKFLNYSVDEDFLVLTFKTPDKYRLDLKRSDWALFQAPETYTNYMGDFKGQMYIRLSQNISAKRINRLNEEFNQKLEKNLEKFPYILKTNDKELYENTKARL